jgi:hypothetical protein
MDGPWTQYAPPQASTPGPWTQYAAQKSVASPAIDAATEFGPSYAAPAAPAAPAAIERIGNAAVQAWKNTPSILTDQAQEAIDKYGGPVGQELVNPAFRALSGIPAAANAAAAGLSQTAMEVLGEKGGRDALAFLNTLPVAAGERLSPEPVTPSPVELRPQFVSERFAPDVSELDSRNAIQALIEHDTNENSLPAITDIGSAPTVEAAIAAADKVVRTPVTATQIAARDNVPLMEAWNRARAENEEEPAPGTQPQTMAEWLAANNPPPEVAPSLPATPVAPLATAIKARDFDGATQAAKQIASGYYQKADAVGGVLTPEFANRFVDEAEQIAPQTNEGKIVLGNSPVTNLIDRIQGLRDQPISLQGAQEIDEGLGNLISNEFGPAGLSKEGKNLFDLQTTFRDMIMHAGPEDIEGGTEGFQALQQGRSVWAQAMKMGDLQRIMDRAALTDNPATGIKSGLRVLLSNPDRARGYSPQEIAALRSAADRGVLGGALHVFGSRLIPVGAGIAGEAAGGLAGAIVAGTVGHMGSTMMRNAATALQSRRLGNALSVLGQGVPEPVLP